MVFVFTFLGEFGFELLNWQGVVRKFSRTLGPADRIVCCSRANVYPLYEMADLYIDISEAPLFMHSRACCYSGTIGAGAPGRRLNRAFDAALRASLRSFVRTRLQALEPAWKSAADRELTFVFSSRKTEVRGFAFGCDPDRIEVEADIYDQLALGANLFEKVRPDLRIRSQIERALGFDLSEPYVLIQSRARSVGPQSPLVPKEGLIGELARRMRVVLLSFDTGRSFDSASRFDPSLRCAHYRGRSFPEQACLIAFARHCVFFTEGDFGSHIYVPPLMGKDVVAIAPRRVYALGTAPTDFWNRNVFRFGGRIAPQVSEEVLASVDTTRELADRIVFACRRETQANAFSAGRQNA
jgi:hypothetical protein